MTAILALIAAISFGIIRNFESKHPKHGFQEFLVVMILGIFFATSAIGCAVSLVAPESGVANVRPDAEISRPSDPH